MYEFMEGNIELRDVILDTGKNTAIAAGSSYVAGGASYLVSGAVANTALANIATQTTGVLVSTQIGTTIVSLGSVVATMSAAYAHMDRYIKTSSTDLQVGGAWITGENGWWYKNPDGTYPSDCWMRSVQNGVDTWYRFNENGYMVSGWYRDKDGKWYFLHDKADGNQGYMYTGWKEINGKWYYFNETADGPKGSLLVNGETPDGYRTDSDGAWIR